MGGTEVSGSTLRDRDIPAKLLVHWKGEGGEGYSIQFRHEEFRGALAAVLHDSLRSDVASLCFTDALEYSGVEEIHETKLSQYNQALQYVEVSDSSSIPRWAFKNAAERCSLLHAIYEVVAVDYENYDRLASLGVENGGFSDMTRGGDNEDFTWCVRVRNYSRKFSTKKDQRHGIRTRSTSKEKEALVALKPLLETFGGAVDLRNPDCKICIFDGLKEGRKILSRKLASGPDVYVMAPNTRICITTTPLCPIAAFSLCNVAGIRPHSRILDPYAGSCATLLASAMLEPSCQTVGIEIAHNGVVNRHDIRNDFQTRNLTEPVALIRGNYMDDNVRDSARNSVTNGQFDFIITDPPYGIRESKMATKPIEDLLMCIQKDRFIGKPLLRRGGKIVCFLPCQSDQLFEEDVMPSKEVLKRAGFNFELCCEQRLNDTLSRWLVSFVCAE